MKIRFLPLLAVEVIHAYHGGRSPDFDFFFPPATTRRLAGAHVLAKVREGRLNLLYEARQEGEAFEPLMSLAAQTLQIGLRLVNPDFCNVTDFALLPALPREGRLLYRNTAADPGALQAPVTLLLDPSQLEDAELLRAGLFCLVEIRVDAGFHGMPPTFQVTFPARAETLRYYVVSRDYTAGEFNQLAVIDAGFATDGRPQIAFDRVPPSGFGTGEIPGTTLGANGERVALFRSQQPVARQAKARKRIQLARNTDVIVAHLPQPGAAAPTADLVIHLSKT